MAFEVPLDRLQRWMQEVVVHPGTTEEGVEAPAARREVPPARVGDVILPSATLLPEERLAIYHDMYVLRMEDALQSDFPALKHFLGDRRFRDLVVGYVRAHPSRSYTLNPLGRQLPDYVRDAPGIRHRAFCEDLARLELAVAEVFDAPEDAPLRAQDTAAVPESAWETARLRPITAFRLMAFHYPVNAYLQSYRDDDAQTHLRRRDTWIAVYRRDYSVWRQGLTRAGHALLDDIAAGKPLGEAVAGALRRGRGRPRPATEAELFRWFRGWMAGGMFRSVEIGS